MKSEILITMGMVWPVSSGKMERCVYMEVGDPREVRYPSVHIISRFNVIMFT